MQLILDQCGGAEVKEPEGVGGDGEDKEDESGCRAAGETPGNQRWEETRDAKSHALENRLLLFHLLIPSAPASVAPPPSCLFVFIFLSLLLLFRYLDVFQPLQLGGVKELSPQRRYRGFTGCIRNLVVDSQVDTLTTLTTHSETRVVQHHFC